MAALPGTASTIGAFSVDASEELERGRSFLAPRYGKRWTELRADLGRSALAAEMLLASGPTGAVPGVVGPLEAVAGARSVMDAARILVETLEIEAGLLGEVLGASLEALPLQRLSRIATALLEMQHAPAPDPAWADPAAARLAGLVLETHGDLLLRARRLHEQVYATFTDRVWTLPTAGVRAGRRRIRPLRRHRIRNALAHVSRSGRPPRNLRATLELLLEASACRAEIRELGPLVLPVLGDFNRGAMTDVVAATKSLTALNALQDAVGDGVVIERVEALLRVDAFSAFDVTSPARAVLAVIEAWSRDVERCGGAEATAFTARELVEWSAQLSSRLGSVEAGVETAGDIGVIHCRLRDLVNDLLARERIKELAASRNAQAPEPLIARHRLVLKSAAS